MYVTLVVRPHATVTPVEDAVGREVADILREWAVLWKKLYLVNSFHDMNLLQAKQKHVGCVIIDDKVRSES